MPGVGDVGLEEPSDHKVGIELIARLPQLVDVTATKTPLVLDLEARSRGGKPSRRLRSGVAVCIRGRVRRHPHGSAGCRYAFVRG